MLTSLGPILVAVLMSGFDEGLLTGIVVDDNGKPVAGDRFSCKFPRSRGATGKQRKCERRRMRTVDSV